MADAPHPCLRRAGRRDLGATSRSRDPRTSARGWCRATTELNLVCVGKRRDGGHLAGPKVHARRHGGDAPLPHRDHPFERLPVDTAVRPDPFAVRWTNPRRNAGEVRRVVTGIPGKGGIVDTLDRETGEFPWATATIVQNVVSRIDGATGAVNENAELIFTAAGQTVLASRTRAAARTGSPYTDPRKSQRIPYSLGESMSRTRQQPSGIDSLRRKRLAVRLAVRAGFPAPRSSAAAARAGQGSRTAALGVYRPPLSSSCGVYGADAEIDYAQVIAPANAANSRARAARSPCELWSPVAVDRKPYESIRRDVGAPRRQCPWVAARSLLWLEARPGSGEEST